MNRFSREVALVVVDVQEGFCGPHTEDLYQRIPDLLPLYQNIVLSHFINHAQSVVARLKGWLQMMDQDPGTVSAIEIPAGLEEDTLVVAKSGFSALTSTSLQWLRDRGIGILHLCGNDTDLCVTGTARDAVEQGFHPIILGRYCASTGGPNMHEAGLLILKRLLGSHNVITASDPAAFPTSFVHPQVVHQ
ncbi:MAG: cysteine hydrolase family protein [Puniceicoccaceae bacterium]